MDVRPGQLWYSRLADVESLIFIVGKHEHDAGIFLIYEHVIDGNRSTIQYTTRENFDSKFVGILGFDEQLTLLEDPQRC